LDVTVKRGRLILGKSIDAADTRMEAIRKGEVDDPINGTEGNGGLGSIPGEGIEPLSSAAC